MPSLCSGVQWISEFPFLGIKSSGAGRVLGFDARKTSGSVSLYHILAGKAIFCLRD